MVCPDIRVEMPPTQVDVDPAMTEDKLDVTKGSVRYNPSSHTGIREAIRDLASTVKNLNELVD
jgi:hypothetical protein